MDYLQYVRMYPSVRPSSRLIRLCLIALACFSVVTIVQHRDKFYLRSSLSTYSDRYMQLSLDYSSNTDDDNSTINRTNDAIYIIRDDNKSNQTSCSAPIITMFTNMMDTEKSRISRHSNTIINWSLLGSCVTNILFVNDINSTSLLIKLARMHGWRILPTPSLNQGIPVIRTMYLTAFALSKTPLYAFANSDILFGSNLVTTLTSLLCALSEYNSTNASSNLTCNNNVIKMNNIKGGIFAVGTRKNVFMENMVSPLPDDVQELYSVVAGFQTNAEDYFITTSSLLPEYKISDSIIEELSRQPSEINITSVMSRISNYELPDSISLMLNETYGNIAYKYATGHFPWQNVPNFVIGRPGYDNWLAAEAIRNSVTWTVDLTNTVTAVHQTGADGAHSGFHAPFHKATIFLNYNIAGNYQLYKLGLTTCMLWESNIESDYNVTFNALQNICPLRRKILVETQRKATKPANLTYKKKV